MSALGSSSSGVVKRYGATRALAALTLDVQTRRDVRPDRPDGAGKRTTIRLMCGLLHADGGAAQLAGPRPRPRSPRAEPSGRVPVAALQPVRRPHPTREPRVLCRDPRRTHYQNRRDQLVGFTQLRPFRTGGGPPLRRHEAKARARVHARPPATMMLLDEPIIGVDPVSRREFWKMLSDFLSEGSPSCCRRRTWMRPSAAPRRMLHEGRVLACDNRRPARRDPDVRVLELPLAVPMRAACQRRLRTIPGFEHAVLFGERLHVTLADTAPTAVEHFAEALRGTPLGDASVRPVAPSLEDVFIAQLATTGARS